MENQNMESLLNKKIIGVVFSLYAKLYQIFF